MRMRTIRTYSVIIAFALLIAVIPVTAVAPAYHDVRPGYGVTRIGWLSDYEPSLKGTRGDTMVFYLESGRPGLDVFVLAGTHTNEISGILAATLIVELAEVKAGRMIVVPHANNSASAVPDSRSGANLTQVKLQGALTERVFSYGDRYTAEPDQPDFLKEPLGIESRNLNRVYPGKPDGTLTERIAYGITSLIKAEGIDIAIDLHEANPKSQLAWNIISPDRTLETAIMVAFELEERGLRMIPDRSGPGYAGYSHWEWSKLGAASYLIETVNPAMETGMKQDPIISTEYPIERRVGVHLETILSLIKYRAEEMGGAFSAEGLPSLRDLLAKGMKGYLR